MDLWQWVGLDGQHLQTWFAQADKGVLVQSSRLLGEEKKMYQVGEPLVTSSLVIPLAFGVREEDLHDAKMPLDIDVMRSVFADTWTFDIILHKDDGSEEPLVSDHNGSPLKALTILSEFTMALADTVEEMGLNFVSFSTGQEAGHFAFLIKRPSMSSLGELVRGLVLMRSCLEILSCARGFKVADLSVRVSSQHVVHVDFTLIETIKKILQHQEAT